MRKLLLQLDTLSASRASSTASSRTTAGADEVMSYGGVTEDAVRDLVHGAIFTRGPKDLHNTAIFIGGTDMSAGERLLGAVRKALLRPDARLGDARFERVEHDGRCGRRRSCSRLPATSTGRRAVVTAGTGPVGMRAAGLLAKQAPTSPSHPVEPKAEPKLAGDIQQRFGASVRAVDDGRRVAGRRGARGRRAAAQRGRSRRSARAARGVGRAAPGCAPPQTSTPSRRSAWKASTSTDNGADRDGVTTFGALGVGNLKMKIHKACIARLFERNDLVLDAESIVEVARTL